MATVPLKPLRVRRPPVNTFENRAALATARFDYGPEFLQSSAIYIALDASAEMRRDAEGLDVWEGGNPEKSRWWVQVTAAIALLRRIQRVVEESEQSGGTPIVNSLAVVLFPTQPDETPFYLYDTDSNDYDTAIEYLEELLARRPVLNTGVLRVRENLSTWIVDGSTGNWVFSEDFNTGTQTVNSPQPTFLVRPTLAPFGSVFQTTISVQTTADDDFIGVAVGYVLGDTANENADYLVVTWKQADQGDGREGLALVRVTGRVDLGNHGANPLWAFPVNQGVPGFPVQQLQRGFNLGSVGWEDFEQYDFRVEYEAANIKVFVNGVLEIDYSPPSGALPTGNFAFFGLSQPQVRYESNENIFPYSPGTPYDEAFVSFTDEDLAADFFDTASQTDRAVLFYSDGVAEPQSSVAEAVQILSALEPVRVFGFGVLLPDTANIEALDNTSEDAVPVLTFNALLSFDGSFPAVVPTTYRVARAVDRVTQDRPTRAVLTRMSLYNPNSAPVTVVASYRSPLLRKTPVEVFRKVLQPAELFYADVGGSVVQNTEVLSLDISGDNAVNIMASYIQITQEVS